MQLTHQSSRKRKELELLLEQVKARNGKNGANKTLEVQKQPVLLPPSVGALPPVAAPSSIAALPPVAGGPGGVDDIAIIGMAGRFPGSPDLVSFWQNLKEGKNLIQEIPQDRWPEGQAAEASEPKPPIKHIGAILDIFSFDAALFGISPREAEAMDPHQRVLLEVVWETLEHAGYAPAQLSGTKTGVFIAMYNTDFLEWSRAIRWEKESLPYLATGSSQALVSNRISYLFNWQGPSEIVSTACSSALVGLHKAAQALRTGDCQMALVGGVSLLLTPTRLLALNRLGILSAAGYCAPFDKDSPGEVMGEGAGAVLLKPLSQARQDGDTIYAVLKATGVNHHGNSSGSITMPSVSAQRDLVIDTYRRAGIDPRTISFIEAHGSGNVGGDMAEWVAFEKAFTTLAQEKQNVLSKGFCGIGSGKGNIGFLEAAGGMAQLLKVILSMQHETLPATLNFKSLSDSIDIEHSPFYMVDKTMPWEALRDENGLELPRRAALNSYGLGGTNAHIVVEAYVGQGSEFRVRSSGFGVQGSELTQNSELRTQNWEPYLFVFSAKEEESLQAYLHKFLAYLESQPELDLKDVAYTLQVGRQASTARLALVEKSLPGLKERVTLYLTGKADNLSTGNVKMLQSQRKALETTLTEQAWRTLYEVRDLDRLGQLWVHGFEIRWPSLYEETPRRIGLPTYAFSKKQFLLHPPQSPPPLIPPSRGETRQEGRSAALGQQTYSRQVSAGEPYLRDHKVNQEYLLPATGQISFIFEGIQAQGLSQYPLVLNRLVWLAPFILNQGEAQCEIVFEPEDDKVNIQLFKRQALSPPAAGPRPESPPELVEACPEPVEWGPVEGGLGGVEACSTAYFHKRSGGDEPDPHLPQDFVATFKAKAASQVKAAEIYRIFAAQKQEYGPTFSLLETVYVQDQYVMSELKVPDEKLYSPLEIQIAILDAAGHGIPAFYLEDHSENVRSHLPFACEKFKLYRPFQPGERYYGLIERLEGKHVESFNTKIINEAGQCFAEFQKLSSRAYATTPPPLIPSGADTRRRGTQSAATGGGTPLSPPVAGPRPEPVEGGVGGDAPLQHKLEQDIRALLAAFLKISEADISVNEALSDYGLDSIAISQTTRILSERLKLEVPVTTFFEYPTIQEVVAYLIEDFGEQLQVWYQPQLEKGSERKQGPTISKQSVKDDRVGQDVAEDEIAVIGLSAQFADSRDIYEYWRHLKQGDNLIRDFREERNVLEAYQASLELLSDLRAGFLGQALQFDAQFFGIADEEAFYMDPQQRLFLEAVWHAVEDAGYGPGTLAGSNTGIFVGVGKNEYIGLLKDFEVNMVSKYIGTGHAISGVANRASYALDVHGPSEAIDTACSSSLVAIHRAVQALKHQECELAIAGGVNLLFSPYSFLVYQNIDCLAADWNCKAFGKGGDGWSVGEGIAAVLLKPLKKALADGDHIYAVIKGSGVIHGGQTHFYLQPNPNKHAELITRVYREAGVDPQTVVYLEAHGTGTEMGDALEFNSFVRAFKTLNQAYQGRALQQQYCGIGSVKSNMGHCEPAAGIASFIKVVLSLYHAQLPPTLHCAEPNPHLRLSSSPFYLVNELTPLETGRPARAGVHSFNFSGGTAHAVLEACQDYSPGGKTEPSLPKLICLSAKTFQSLLAYLQSLHSFLQGEEISQFSGYTLENIAYTLQAGRDAYAHRWFVQCHDLAECISALGQCLTAESLKKDPHYAVTAVNNKKAGKLEPDQAQEWLEAGQWVAIGQAWLAGQKIDWRQLYPCLPRRVSLPGYVFDKSRTYGPEWREGNIYLRGYKATTALPPEQVVEPLTLKIVDKIEASGRNVGRPSVEAQLIQIIANLLDVSPTQLDPDMNMMALNLDSLKMVALSERVNRCFQIRTTPPDFFLFNEIRELVDFIREAMDTPLQRGATSPRGGALRAASACVRSAGNEGGWSRSSPAPAHSPLVPIRSQGHRPPFFCVHPWSGMVYPYFNLAQELGPDQPFYGLQAVGLYQAPQRSIEEMAGHYLEALQTVQPEPPYLLGGWSLGGLIAFEMAQQLRRSGREVALLALIDTPASTRTGLLSTTKFLVTGVGPYIWPYVYDYLRLMSASEGSSMARILARELYSLTASHSTVRRILHIVQTTMVASSNYLPQPYPDRITLFRVQKQSAPDDQSQTLGWNKLSAKEVEAHHLPGHHFDILRKPHVQFLAGRLQACIDRVQADQAEPIGRELR